MITQEALQEILAIKEKVFLTPDQMADKLNITFYPFEKDKVSKEVLQFRQKLEESFERLKVNIIPFEKSTEIIPFRKVFIRCLKIILNNLFYGIERIWHKPDRIYINSRVLVNSFRRKRIKKGISVVSTGENETNDLPMDNTSSFTESSVITILDLPADIKDDSSFHKHFDTAMAMFAHHMTNIVLAVTAEKWIIYNFNASHPVYKIDEEFDQKVLKALIPKIVAPIRPYKYSEFIVKKEPFDPFDKYHQEATADMVESGNLLEKTGLYPKGKQIDSLPFRNSYYRWIGKLHLDNRNGMSYGFLARQLPAKLSPLLKEKEAKELLGNIPDNKDYFYHQGDLYATFLLNGDKFFLKVPEVWVLSQRSGCDKTNMNPQADLIKLGLVAGKMYLQAPKSLKLNSNFKTSFDTKVILAHAVGNAIVASILAHFDSQSGFARRIEGSGVSITHWHGYINSAAIPAGYTLYGQSNPHVACSSPQSAIYALDGKLQAFSKSFEDKKDYVGDIHIEPHHGTNIVFDSLKSFGDYIINTPDSSTLGNKYLHTYNSY